MRHAFGLPQVLLIILFIGGIVTITMRYASLGAKHYADSYTREQAELFMQSATEAVLLRIAAFDRNNPAHDCLKELNVTSSDNRFLATVSVEHYYLADGSLCANVPYTPIQSEESHGMITLKVVVTSQDAAKILHPIHLERRSLQRP